MENPPDSDPVPNWELDTLNRIAQALDTRLKISFESYGTLVHELDSVTSDSLRRPDVANDPDLHPRPPIPIPDSNAPERTRWMQERMIPWLWGDQLNIETLMTWLQGYNLPPVGHEEEPYHWLLRGIPATATPEARDYMERHLAEGLTIILGEEPDMHPVVADRHDEFLTSLYWTCAGLNRPAFLAEPLWEAYKRLKYSKLSGAHRDALQAAMVQNQSGDRALKEIWEPMVEKGKQRWLRGTEVVGYEGILARHRTVKPDFEKVFWALSTISRRWEGTKEDRIAFKGMVWKVPGLEHVNAASTLLTAADGWSTWARSVLPIAHTIPAVDGSLEVCVRLESDVYFASWRGGEIVEGIRSAEDGSERHVEKWARSSKPSPRLLMNSLMTRLGNVENENEGPISAGVTLAYSQLLQAIRNPPESKAPGPDTPELPPIIFALSIALILVAAQRLPSRRPQASR